MDFRVNLEIFRGPLDLLLYLVRRHEVEIVDIPIAEVADQFLEYLAVLEKLDVNAVGDFLEMASTLVEIKSRLVLPRGDEIEEEFDDPRQELVARLLEYKKFKDAASILEERSRGWQDRYSRLASDLATRPTDPAEQPIREVELWDLVSAFGRLLRDSAATQGSSIVYDETPIWVYMHQIHAQVAGTGRLAFRDALRKAEHKSTQVSMFLAILELARHHHIHFEQLDLFGEIWILRGENFDRPLDLSTAGNYDEPRDEAE
jgi:segregation and condensation protein A